MSYNCSVKCSDKDIIMDWENVIISMSLAWVKEKILISRQDVKKIHQLSLFHVECSQLC